MDLRIQAEINRKLDATYFGIVYHPELRGHLTKEGKENIFEMLKTLTSSLTADDCDHKYWFTCKCGNKICAICHKEYDDNQKLDKDS